MVDTKRNKKQAGAPKNPPSAKQKRTADEARPKRTQAKPSAALPKRSTKSAGTKKSPSPKNTLTTKNKGGRPPVYSTPQELEEKINLYFITHGRVVLKDENGQPVLDKNGCPVITVNPPSLVGLAYYLGFASRQSLEDYEKREAFSYVIARARMRVEEFCFAQLHTGQSAGAQFHLAQFGYVSRKQLDLANPDGKSFVLKWDDGSSKKEESGQEDE